MITKLLYYLIIIISLFSFSCKKANNSDSTFKSPLKDTVIKSPSGHNTAGRINIPVSKQNPAVASSTLDSMIMDDNTYINYSPKKVLDFNVFTAWIENSKTGGVGEWLAIYLGEGGSIKDISEVEVYILTSYSCGSDYLIPTLFNIELYADTTLISSSKDANENNNDFMVGVPSFMKSTVKNLQSGIIWVKITILKTEIGWKDYADKDNKGNNNAYIADVFFNIKNYNPHNLKEAITKFAKGVNEKNKSIISEFTNIPYKKVLEVFTNMFDTEKGPKCDPTKLRIHSENTALVYASEGGDCNFFAKFEYINGKWNFIKTISLSN